ncbi:hypothetical protein BDV27DRAFT_136149 [Aspergillus caelatus]|uniref:Uncharacterized protein n=1 Tax=Aspergillus caelatus TaxID=61420 RepID=A0A5N6ZP83_9EURO|nr:uncharacterized protein BDV27DRAFT_136149 [Aspergillus caelatus]KAE8359427.1 hypothetical protein BDV27DRAFT_136149 [Aspergillus caelatus]
MSHICNRHQKHRGSDIVRGFPMGESLRRLCARAYAPCDTLVQYAAYCTPLSPLGEGGDGRIRFRSFWLGWCFFFFLLGEWLLSDWEEWCVSLANLLGAGPVWSYCLSF